MAYLEASGAYSRWLACWRSNTPTGPRRLLDGKGDSVSDAGFCSVDEDVVGAGRSRDEGLVERAVGKQKFATHDLIVGERPRSWFRVIGPNAASRVEFLSGQSERLPGREIDCVRIAA